MKSNSQNLCVKKETYKKNTWNNSHKFILNFYNVQDFQEQ
jgi:hypothetical protein